jgi:signal transduction histidine kinase
MRPMRDLHAARMDLYSRKQRWKLLLAAVAALIVGVSLWYSSRIVDQVRDQERQKVRLWAEAVKSRAQLVNYTDSLFDRLREEERKKVELWAEATVQLLSSSSTDLGFFLKMIQSNTTIPVIITDEAGEIKSERNLDPGVAMSDERKKKEVAAMDKVHEPIVITVVGDEKQYLHYKDSRIITDLERVMDNIIGAFISETVMNTAAVPVILTDATQKKVVESSNVDSAVLADPMRLRARIREMSAENPPIEVDLAGRGKHWIFYQGSLVVTQLRYFPYVQLLIIGLFLLVGYALFSVFRAAEQDQVWVGMAKETAHQLGTPLSSLMGWVEMLKGQHTDPAAIAEMHKDLDRLEVITERFSKIGSTPELVPEKLYAVLRATVLYLRPRLPGRVKIEVNTPANPEQTTPLNRPLFSWVIENLIRNAVDAMEGEGSVTIDVVPDGPDVHVDVTDTGKGIPTAQHRTVFQPGFTTKKRGWGLGLSLSRRIIEKYHAGRIFVKRSAPGKGTTFRITLKA